jgi:hypothetical protein
MTPLAPPRVTTFGVATSYQWEQRGSHYLVFDDDGRAIMQVDLVRNLDSEMVYAYAYGTSLGVFRDLTSAKNACMRAPHPEGWK